MLALARRFYPELPSRRGALLSLAGGVRPQVLPQLDLRTLVLIRLGDEVAREGFLDAWRPVVLDEARRYGARGGDREELEAEGLLALWEGVTQYDPQRHRSTAERYIQNHIHRRVRRRYREQVGYDRPSVVPLDLAGLADREMEAAERWLDLERASERLPSPEREQWQRYLRLAAEGAGPDEAAKQLAALDGTSFPAWKKRLERIRKKVRSHLA